MLQLPAVLVVPPFSLTAILSLLSLLFFSLAENFTEATGVFVCHLLPPHSSYVSASALTAAVQSFLSLLYFSVKCSSISPYSSEEPTDGIEAAVRQTVSSITAGSGLLQHKLLNWDDFQMETT